MKTLIVQSYRTRDVPRWISMCLDSVRDWAHGRSYDYELIDDSFFGFAPQWFRDRCKEHFYPVTDLARLYLIRDRFGRGYDRVAWLDADVVIFDPERFAIDTRSGYAFCHEVVLGILPNGQLELSGASINNSVIVMHRGHPMLDYYLFAAEETIRHTPERDFSRMMIGPKFLNALAGAMPLERLTCVGLFTPIYMTLLAQGSNRPALAMYRKQFGFPISGANLCHFTRGDTPITERARLDACFESAILKLIESRGAVVNVIE